MKNIKELIQKINSRKGRLSNHEEEFIRILFTSHCGNNLRQDCKGFKPEVILDTFGLTSRTVMKRMKQGEERRIEIKSGKVAACKVRVKGKRTARITDQMKSDIIKFVDSHESVRVSPCVNDTLKIGGQSVPKKIIEISIIELHKDLASSNVPGILDDNNNITIGETHLRSLLAKEMPHLRPATNKHLEMCGCVICIVMQNLQRALNNYRKKKVKELENKWKKMKLDFEERIENHRKRGVDDAVITFALANVPPTILCAQQEFQTYQDFAYPDSLPRHAKPSDTLKEMMCPQKMSAQGRPLFHWKCVLGKCHLCPEIERNDFELKQDDMIHFEHYVQYSRCTKHGLLGEGVIKECTLCKEINKEHKISTKKERTKDKKKVESFYNEFYVPYLQKYRYHYPHMKILSQQQIAGDREKVFQAEKKIISTSRDWAEAFSVVLNKEIQNDHYGWVPKIYVESSTFKFHSQDKGCLQEHYYAHFSDDAKQHASTCYENLRKELNLMKKLGVLVENQTVILDHTDGCCAQYRSASAICLLSMLSNFFLVPINRMIHAPSHGKGKVDGLGAVTKRFLLNCMRNTNNDVSNNNPDRRFTPWLHKDRTSNSFARQAQSLCEKQFGNQHSPYVDNKRKKRAKKCNF